MFDNRIIFRSSNKLVNGPQGLRRIVFNYDQIPGQDGAWVKNGNVFELSPDWIPNPSDLTYNAKLDAYVWKPNGYNPGGSSAKTIYMDPDELARSMVTNYNKGTSVLKADPNHRGRQIYVLSDPLNTNPKTGNISAIPMVEIEDIIDAKAAKGLGSTYIVADPFLKRKGGIIRKIKFK